MGILKNICFPIQHIKASSSKNIKLLLENYLQVCELICSTTISTFAIVSSSSCNSASRRTRRQHLFTAAPSMTSTVSVAHSARLSLTRLSRLDSRLMKFLAGAIVLIYSFFSLLALRPSRCCWSAALLRPRHLHFKGTFAD
jgi:hypothetical protein